MTTRHVFVLAAAAVGLSACTVSVQTQDFRSSEAKTFKVDGTPDLTLVTFDGAIEIRSWDRPEVQVQIEKRGSTQELANSIEVQAGQDGRRIRIEARRPAQGDALLRWNSSRSARLIATVPRTCDLLARSGDGSIAIERVQGRLELRTGDGAIKGYEIDGDVTVNTGDGQVNLRSVAGNVDVRTGDGGVEISGRPALLRVHTGDGGVRVSVDGGVAMSGDWNIDTGDGGVVLDLPAGFRARLDAQTGDGRVRFDRDLAAQITASDDKRTARGSIGGGGPVLKVRTGDGGISVSAAPAVETATKPQVER
jgi:hypothetical protein